MEPLLHSHTRAQAEALVGSGPGQVFHGPRSVGKYQTAIWAACRLNCVNQTVDDCLNCRRIRAGNYPDLITVAPKERPSIIIEQIRELLGSLALSRLNPQGTRVVIIDEANRLTVEASNALLKILEEPPESTKFILVTDALEELLPTVRSRLAAIYFAPVPLAELASWLEQTSGLSPTAARNLAELAAGLPGAAVNLATSPEQAALHQRLLGLVHEILERPVFERLIAARAIIDEKLSPADVISLLHRHLVTNLTAGTYDQPGRLAALSRARSLIDGGVTARVVLDRLMVELG